MRRCVFRSIPAAELDLLVDFVRCVFPIAEVLRLEKCSFLLVLERAFLCPDAVSDFPDLDIFDLEGITSDLTLVEVRPMDFTIDLVDFSLETP